MTARVPLETTLSIRDTCLCLHAQRAARALARRFDEALRPVALTNGQFSLLNALNGPAPAPMALLAAALGADRTTLTAALKPLVREGLAEISVDPEDQRARRVTLTAAGQDRLAVALPLWAAVHAALETELADPDRARRDLLTLSALPAPAAPSATTEGPGR